MQRNFDLWKARKETTLPEVKVLFEAETVQKG